MKILRPSQLLPQIFIALLITVSSIVSADELKVGELAPDFSLPAADGKTYSLKDYLGKQVVVLAWYPKAKTRYCTLECKSFVDHGDKLREYDIQYFMASVDELEDNIEFAKETKADFPMLSDESKQVAEAYDVLNFLGFSDRVTFFIGKDGKILKIDEDIHAKTAAQDVMETLDDLKVAKKSAPETTKPEEANN